MSNREESENRNDAKEELRDQFFQSGIQQRWHFTKYGYYKLYGENRFWLAFITQVIAALIFVIALINIVVMVVNKDVSNQESIITMLALSASIQTISEFFVGDYMSSAKMFIGAATLTYIYIIIF
ncbi:hypothetical protein EI165_08635 [Pseudoalteromonas nigrifaciens]|uniref:hypothetical protein n=1 Tax=Pseudoalteromonas nigrifaciens TaxID=28109 RepID=UPI0017879785|nr:hypothetical protein [Pseudoalteromonas nigrifaciens]MBE0420189.1 hypothetical protein [Pseudoalteromonas nigrifaciens]